MREINVSVITNTVKELCIKANKTLPCDIKNSIHCAINTETDDVAISVLKDYEKNIESAKKLNIPVCQDTGMAVIFLEVGQDVHFVGGSLNEAINNGVKLGYDEGYLRKSVVKDPLFRENTNDNTPAVIHTKVVDGENVKITVAPKGFGSENMSKIKMLTPADGEDGVINAVVDIVKSASNKPCPPMVIGVGIGGDFEQCALLSKMALVRSIDIRNENEFYKNLENKILYEVNKLDIGPQGFGGKTTALAVNIETAPTHIAGLPVAVNIGCHVTRHETAVI